MLRSIGLFKLIALLSLSFLAACSTNKPNPNFEFQQTTAQKQSSEEKKTQEAELVKEEKSVSEVLSASKKNEVLAAGNLIRMTSTVDTNLNGKFRISKKGVLALPYNVQLDARGLKLSELQTKARAAYKPYFRGSAPVSVKLLSKDVYLNVQGLVKQPGSYLVEPESGLQEVVALAGGLEQDQGTSDFPDYVSIGKDGLSVVVKLSDYYRGRIEQDWTWVGDERLFFQTDPPHAKNGADKQVQVVQILGEVIEPGEYSYQSGEDFFSYLVKAGGPTSFANLDNVQVIRTIGRERHATTFSASGSGRTPVLLAGDILVVHSERPSTFITNLSGVLGSISAALLAVVAL